MQSSNWLKNNAEDIKTICILLMTAAIVYFYLIYQPSQKKELRAEVIRLQADIKEAKEQQAILNEQVKALKPK